MMDRGIHHPKSGNIPPDVFMMNTADAGQGNGRPGVAGRLFHCMAWNGRFLAQSAVSAIPVVIQNVIEQKFSEMFFAERDYAVEQFAAAVSDPALRDSENPGTQYILIGRAARKRVIDDRKAAKKGSGLAICGFNSNCDFDYL
jgi:hypothetical protein